MTKDSTKCDINEKTWLYCLPNYHNTADLGYKEPGFDMCQDQYFQISLVMISFINFYSCDVISLLSVCVCLSFCLSACLQNSRILLLIL